MVLEICDDHTLYHIRLTLPESQTITIGKKGSWFFPRGDYLYVGSAKRNIRARIARHVKKEKKKHWHLDYFRPFATIVEIKTYPSTFTECQLAKHLKEMVHGTVIMKGFGSSDCHCDAHFYYIKP